MGLQIAIIVAAVIAGGVYVWIELYTGGPGGPSAA